MAQDGTAEPARENKFSGANGDKGMSIFPVQLTTSRIGNLTRSIHTLILDTTMGNVPYSKINSCNAQTDRQMRTGGSTSHPSNSNKQNCAISFHTTAVQNDHPLNHAS